MAQTIIALVVLAAVVGVVFLMVWLADAKRAEDVENNPERLDADETPQNHQTPDDRRL